MKPSPTGTRVEGHRQLRSGEEYIGTATWSPSTLLYLNASQDNVLGYNAGREGKHKDRRCREFVRSSVSVVSGSVSIVSV